MGPGSAQSGDSVESPILRRLVDIADKVPAMLAYWDRSLHCRFANRSYEKWFGVKAEAMIGREMSEFLGPLFALNRPYVEGALRGEEQEFERTIPDPAGGPARHSQAHYIPDVVDGEVRGFCVLVVDISTRKRAEEALLTMERQLQAAERVNAMATLAAGIAHEINNPLAAALMDLDFSLQLARKGNDPELLVTSLIDARESAIRIRDIVRTMTLLARGDATTRTRVDVNETLAKSIDLASHTLRYRARLVRDFGEATYVDANAVQLAQVFVNLLVTAAHTLSEERAAQNEIRITSRHEGESIVVAIADNGPGLPEDVLSHIFDPFFTTKEVGRGRGLGLSISHSIVTGIGGTIAVESHVDRGTVFRVLLPVAGSLSSGPPSSPRAQLKGDPQGKIDARLRVLVVDDEIALTLALRRLLEIDYDVTTLNQGGDAIDALMGGDPPFDVILCDLMMPNVSGADVYEKVTRARPELVERFVFMTGGTFTPRGRQFLDACGAPVVTKPFELSQLTATIARVGRRLPPR